MASSTQKKTTTKKSGSRSGSRTAKGKQPQKRPIRREVGGVILLVLALCVLVSYCGVQAILIDLLAKLLKGLFGYGYWLAGPAMLLAGGILLLHRGRPVTLRATCALLLPLLAGALFHTIFAGGDYALNGWGVLKNLWTAGLALKAGRNVVFNGPHGTFGHLDPACKGHVDRAIVHNHLDGQRFGTGAQRAGLGIKGHAAKKNAGRSFPYSYFKGISGADQVTSRLGTAENFGKRFDTLAVAELAHQRVSHLCNGDPFQTAGFLSLLYLIAVGSRMGHGGAAAEHDDQQAQAQEQTQRRCGSILNHQ